jgi:hypothetical protein
MKNLRRNPRILIAQNCSHHKSRVYETSTPGLLIMVKDLNCLKKWMEASDDIVY